MKGVPITVSFDRTVYPINSIMHIRFNLREIIKNELIYMEIRNSDNKVITSRKFNPKKSKNLEKIVDYIFQTNIMMKGDQWKIGHSYLVVAKYDNFEVTDSMTIDKREPIVQTDKSVYIIGSDVIVTVIAPDLDKDNEKAETIGNKPHHCLTISSSHGEIKNYKLLETDDSTGIFQGVITLVPAYSTKKGKREKNIPKSMGPFNGQLPVSIGEEIIIEFESESGNAVVTMFSSNFGVAIELDQKTYVPTDKVYITIVAPDFNYNPNKPDVIGNRPDCKISIQTSKGKLTNYKLIETGKDTGIFTGEIILTSIKENFPNNFKFNSKKIGITRGNGPRNGRLVCGKNDKLTVTLDTESDKFVGSALIRYNIGEISWDDENYNIPSTAKIRVIDPDMNLDPEKIDILKIKVWSDTDLEGTTLELMETNEATGIFEGVLLLDEKPTSKNRLKVSYGDQLFAKYVDWNLPPEIKKSNTFDILATAKVNFEQPRHTVKILAGSSTPHTGKYLDPEIITIKSGTTIRWENEDNAAHTITSGIPGDGPDGKFDSSMFSSKEFFEKTFDQPGEYQYFCMLHPWKSGKIIVKAIETKPMKVVLRKH